MFTSILNVFKNFLGFNATETESRKRPRQDARNDFDFPDDISTDEDTDFEYITSIKRQKLDNNESSEGMADWIRAQKGFSQNFFYSKEKPSQDSSKREGCERFSVRLKHMVNAKSDFTEKILPLQSSFSLRSEALLDDENDENKCLEKTSFSDSQAKQLEKQRSSQRSISKSRLMNGSNHSHSFNHSQRKSTTENYYLPRSTVSRCTQLQEKEKYRQLLNRFPQPFTSFCENDSLSLRHSINHHHNNVSKLGSSFLQNSSITKEKLTKPDKEEQIKHLLQSSSSSSSSKHVPRRNFRNTNGFQTLTNDDTLEKAIKRDKILSHPRITETKFYKSTSKSSVTDVAKWKMKSDELNCPYIDKTWLEEWKNKLQQQEKERKQQIEETRKRIDALTPTWEKEFRELEKNIKVQLSIAEKQSEVLEEIYMTKDDEDLLEDEEIEPMTELSAEMEKKIDGALRPKPPNEVLVDKFQIPIHRRDMETLQDLNWLNDAIINFYMNLLMERGRLDNMPSVYACNTFFYPKLINGGHAALKRWTRKTDIFSYDILLIPVHLGVHWCLAVVDFRKKMIKYYDSMGGKNNECLNSLSTYLQEESLDKKKQTLSMDDWIIENVSDAPQQMNSSDCGMFACKYAEYITRNAKITFKQHHMPYFRRRMVYEILTAQLL